MRFDWSKIKKNEQDGDTKKERLTSKALAVLVIRVFKLMTKVHTPLFVLNLVFFTIVSLLPLLTSFINSRVLDSIIAFLTSPGTTSTNLPYLIMLFILSVVLSDLIRSIDGIVDINFSERAALYIERLITEKISLLDLGYFEDSETNDLIQKAESNLNKPLSFMRLVLSFIANTIFLVTTLIILMQISPVIPLILLAGALPGAINNAFYGVKLWRLVSKYTELRRDFRTTRQTVVLENSLKEVRIFGLRTYLLEDAFAKYNIYWQQWIAFVARRRVNELFLGLISTLSSVIVFYILVTHTLSGLITVGLFTFYLSTSSSFSSKVSRLLNELASMYESGLYVNDVFKALDLRSLIVSGTKSIEKHAVPKIQFKNVTFKYPHSDKAVIENFNLLINPGDHVALVGENGAGKTTLIKLLMRFYDVTDGEILINDINIKELDIDNWYSLIGALFQDYNFYHFDAKTNIGVGNINALEDMSGIIDAAKKAGAHEFIEEYENKYDQVLSKSFKGGINPSEGQKQKIALARTFFKNAPILIMDEPTSAIDPKAEYEIFEEILSFAQEKTVLIISHRFSTVRNADRIIVLDHGKIVEDGSHEELMQIEDGKYKHAFELQKRGYV